MVTEEQPQSDQDSGETGWPSQPVTGEQSGDTGAKQAPDETEESTEQTTESQEGQETKPTKFDLEGEEVTPEQIKEWKAGYLRQEDYTRKTQSLAEERSRLQEALGPAKGEEKSDEDPEVAEARRQLIEILEPEIERRVEKKVSERVTDSQLRDRQERKIEELTKKYDGTDGRPKFDLNEALEYAKERGVLVRENFEDLYFLANRDALVDWEIKQAKSKRATPTERPTPAANIRTPEGKRPASIKEAGKALLSRMSQGREEL